MLVRNVLRSTIAWVLMVSGMHSALATVYSVRDLGVLTDLSGNNDSKPNGISDDGKVALSNVTNGVYRALLYDGAWTNLGTLGGLHSYGAEVNDSAEVVGHSLLADYGTHAFLWTPGGTNGVTNNPEMMDLGTFSGGTNSKAAGINSSHEITGYSETGTHDQAFLYSGGMMTDIGALLGPVLPNSYGLGINDAGHIVGTAYDEFYTWPHAFYYDGSTVSDIGILEGVEGASALAINNNEQIAGYANISNFFVHAFRYADGTMQDLGTLGGHYSYAIAINNSNVIVGGSFVDANDSVYHAFISVGNSLVDLNNTLEASGAGWTLTEARGINDAGQCVGVGMLNGVEHAFLLNPAPVITGVKVSETNVLISFRTINAGEYSLASRDNLTSGGWSNVVTNIQGTGGTVTVTNWGGAARSQCFYRVGLSGP